MKTYLRSLIQNSPNSIGYILISISCIAYSYLAYLNFPSEFDDAYMFLRYAKQIISGYGHSWNIGEGQVYGSTSLTHLIVVTFLRWVLFFASDTVILFISSAIPSVATVCVFGYTASRIVKHQLFQHQLVLCIGIASVLFGCSEHFYYHFNTGMDTMLCFLMHSILISYVLIHWDRQWQWKEILITSVLTYVVFLTRPEHILPAGVFVSLYIILFQKEAMFQIVGKFVLSMIFLLCLDSLVKFLIFGDILPLAFYSKKSGFYIDYNEEYWPQKHFIHFFFLSVSFGLSVILVYFKLIDWKKALIFCLPVGLLILYLLTVVQIMGYRSRYYHPVGPYILFFALTLLPATFRLTKIKLTVFIVSVLLLSANSIWVKVNRDIIKNFKHLIEKTPRYFPKIDTEYCSVPDSSLNRNHRWWLRTMTQVDSLLREIPENIVISSSEYGIIGADYPRLTIIDPLGLHNPEIAKNGFSYEALVRKKPSLIWFAHSDYRTIFRRTLSNPAFWNDYDYYPTVFEFGMAIRKDEHSEYVTNIVDKYHRKYYNNRPISTLKATPHPEVLAGKLIAK
jgi:hypothetical protein